MHPEVDISQDIRRVADAGQRRGPDCPDEAALAAYADAALGSGRRAEIEEHLAGCSFCLGQVGFLVRQAEREPPAVPQNLLDAVRGSERRFAIDWWPTPAWKALAAAAALVVAVAVMLQLGRPSDPLSDPQAIEKSFGFTTSPEPDRTVRNDTMVRALSIIEPVEGALLAGPEIEVRWQADPQAIQYTVLLVNLEGDQIWEERTTGSGLTVPTASLRGGARYFFWVEATLRDGGAIKSRAVGFRLTPD
jgi:hypothetical protein